MDVRAALVGDPAALRIGEADLGDLPSHDHLRAQRLQSVPELQGNLQIQLFLREGRAPGAAEIAGLGLIGQRGDGLPVAFTGLLGDAVAGVQTDDASLQRERLGFRFGLGSVLAFRLGFRLCRRERFRCGFGLRFRSGVLLSGRGRGGRLRILCRRSGAAGTETQAQQQ